MPRVDGQIQCTRCQQPVHDLSAMTRAQAETFVGDRQGQPTCVRYRVDDRGEPEFRLPSPTSVRLAAVAALALSACAAYAEPGDIDSPAEAMMCEDVSGYTIPCADQPPSNDRVDDATADPPAPEPTTPTNTEDSDETPETISAHDVLPLPRWLDPAPPPTGEGCPLPTPTDHGSDIVGRLPVDRGYTRRERARDRRARRRAKRRGKARDDLYFAGRMAEF